MARSTVPARPKITVPVLGTLVMPPPDHLVFYAALGVLGVLEIVEWPIVLIVGMGHYLTEHGHSPALRQVGEAAAAA
ncbi:hypothetical protein Pth03_54990 [Planotetraspora thailandica]|uniref:Uncharacterized protein n=1 Tax=Planotetraspora thailandica TaxID=487172 RepID=A0A8J3XYA8_9ACTN|nr:hypothetical protein [Planotetraspora thailandica]GII57110.1 hypothetical protein Pth03_54990 [Planotetraspora thailandica]